MISLLSRKQTRHYYTTHAPRHFSGSTKMSPICKKAFQTPSRSATSGEGSSSARNPESLGASEQGPPKAKRRTIDQDSLCSAGSRVTATTVASTASSGPLDEYHEVEKVIGKKTHLGKVYYKLKWKGFKEPTWEIAANCTCTYLIEQFESIADLPGVQDEEEDEWEVEEILNKRIRKGETEYLVKWKGWPGKPTWESAENCRCINLIAAYENPKLRKLWNFQGSNQKLWLDLNSIYRYMKKHLAALNLNYVHLFKFKPDLPVNEKPFDLKEGINIGPLCYKGHWYLVILLKNHICYTRKLMIGDSLNTLIGTDMDSHPVVRRLSKIYPDYPIKPMRITQMDRSDVCAFYTLAAFERAIFLLDAKASFVVDQIFFDSKRAEVIRSKLMPDTDGAVSAALKIPKPIYHDIECEYCGKTATTWKRVDKHIRKRHRHQNDFSL